MCLHLVAGDAGLRYIEDAETADGMNGPYIVETMRGALCGMGCDSHTSCVGVRRRIRRKREAPRGE